MTPTEVKAIDDWRFENRIGSRGDAIRKLCQIGLVAHEDMDRALSEGSDLWNTVTDLHHVLWTIMMQVRGREEFANPPLPSKSWTSEEVTDRALEWVGDLMDQSRVLYLDLLSLNNRIYSLADTKSLAASKREADREHAAIQAMREETIRRREEGEHNRSLGVVIHWMKANPALDAKYDDELSEEQQEEYLNRVTLHVREVGKQASLFTDEEIALIRRSNDEPYDFGGVAEVVAGHLLFSPEADTAQHVESVLKIFPTADPKMIEIMVDKARVAAQGRDMSIGAK